MQVLRKLVFLPIVWIFFELLYLGFNKLMVFYIQLSPIWIIILYFLLGTVLLGLLGVVGEIFAAYSKYITKNEEFIFWTITVIAVMFALLKIYNSWSQDIEYVGNIKLAAIAMTAWTFNLTIGFLFGAYKGAKGESDWI